MYIISWVIITNIMLINLMIALFSDTYSKLIQMGNGLFLIEIINVRSSLQFDSEYGGLIILPFPLHVIAFPLVIPYLLIKNKRFNDIVSGILYFFYISILIMPFVIIVSPIFTSLAYIKCILNKLYLIIYARSLNQRIGKFFMLLLFISIGPLFLSVQNIFDIVKFVVYCCKSEKSL
jgi:hypothetical protein